MTQARNNLVPQDQNVKERLLIAAARIFAEKGYAAASVREIVAAAGVTKPVLYYYFGNKEGLFLAIFDRVVDRMEAVLSSYRQDSQPAIERIIGLTDAIYLSFLEDIDTTRMVHSLIYGSPQGAPSFNFERFYFKLTAFLLEIIDHEMAEGTFRSAEPMDVAWVVLGILHVSINCRLYLPEVAPGREGLSRMIRLFLKGLAVKPY